MVAVLMAVAAGCTAGLDETMEAGGDLPLSVSVEFSVEKNANPNVTITARLRNLGDRPLTLRVRCSVIEIDQDQAGTWQRLGDLRLCAPPNQETLAAGATRTATDWRLLSPGNYRVVIEGDDGRSAVSEPFAVPALR